MLNEMWQEVLPCLKMILGIIATCAIAVVTIFCNSLTKRLKQRLEIEEKAKKDQILDKIVTDAVRTVEEEANMSTKLSSKNKEDQAVKIILDEAKRKGLGNPISEHEIRQKIKAKVNEIYNS